MAFRSVTLACRADLLVAIYGLFRISFTLVAERCYAHDPSIVPPRHPSGEATMRHVRNAAAAGCILLAVLCVALWIQGQGRISSLDYLTDGRQVQVVWTGYQVNLQWMRPTGGFSPGWTYLTRPAAPSEAEQWMRTRQMFAGFGYDLGLFDIAIFGDIVVPWWSLLVACALYPARRAYRWRRPVGSARKRR